MRIGKGRAAVGPLRMLLHLGAARERTDGQLLERFTTDPGEAGSLAFAALVERHAAMVLRVCRGVLSDPDEASDAFQATFLVLVRKARGLWVQDSLAPWLHRVAHRTALGARASAARRRRVERLAAIARDRPRAPEFGDDLGCILHEEIDRLPERYRVPLILCDLEGRTHEQAARHLGWPVGTVKSRQSRGRERLRDRLVRRGVAPGAALTGSLGASAEAAIPPALIRAATAAAGRFLTSRAIAPGAVASLTRETLRSLTMMRWLKVAAIFLTLGASGAGVIALGQKDRPGGEAAAKDARKADVPTYEAKTGKLTLKLTERGNLEAVESSDVYSKVEGQTTIIAIKAEGMMVKKGDIVAELDSAELRDRLVNQQITTRRAKADLDNTEKTREVAQIAIKEYLEGSFPQDKAALESQILLARTSADKVEARRDRALAAQRRVKDTLSRKGALEVTAPDIAAELEVDERVDELELARMKERLALDNAKRRLDVLLGLTKPKTVTELEVNVKKAESDVLAKTTTYELERTKEAKLRRMIESCVLHAPNDGMLVYADAGGRQGQPMIEEGATVRERQKIFSIPNLKGPMRVNVKVRESLVDRVERGMPVKIKVDALPGQEMTGKVMSVAPLPDAASFAQSGRKVYTTYATIQDGPAALRPGMTAQAEILLGEIDDAIGVPAESVVKLDGKFQIAVKGPDGTFSWREVEFGAGDGRVVQVRSGLKSGESVALDPLSLLTEEEKDRRVSTPGRVKAKGAKP